MSDKCLHGARAAHGILAAAPAHGDSVAHGPYRPKVLSCPPRPASQVKIKESWEEQEARLEAFARELEEKEDKERFADKEKAAAAIKA